MLLIKSTFTHHFMLEIYSSIPKRYGASPFGLFIFLYNKKKQDENKSKKPEKYKISNSIYLVSKRRWLNKRINI